MSDAELVSQQELEEAKKEESAKAGRKKAGLPELELDALPSSLANKMSNLFQVDHAACIAQLPAHAAQRWPGRHRGD